MIAVVFNNKLIPSENWRKYFSVEARLQNKTSNEIIKFDFVPCERSSFTFDKDALAAFD